MKLNKKEAQVYIPNGEDENIALTRTTHLAIAAHQDDVEFMAYHGIAQCYESEEKHFSAVVVTNGSGSPRAGEYAKITDQEMMAVRQEEQKQAANIGKYSALMLLMYHSSEIKDNNNTNTVDDIYNILLATKPEIVYTHNFADKHETHVSVALRTIAAIRKMPKADRPKKVYGCEVWRDLDWLDDSDKVLLDVSYNQPLVTEIMEIFKSQIGGGKRYDKAVLGRRIANATFLQDHAVDTHTHLTYAMDLTPLINDESLKITDVLRQHLDKFANSVLAKLTH